MEQESSADSEDSFAKSEEKLDSIDSADDTENVKIFRETDPISPIKIGIANI